ncbi:hypothetical protein NDU88_002223 [Pleurodeles waltl]|uniref:Uncharacterized protein n=1 Tax=Pleurodeles waltl TaxID=8319 RepID=A0AAV7UZ71_PLEWA|nr:hypothetical protein NDU88_002223 [Pleurodeles waltl]
MYGTMAISRRDKKAQAQEHDIGQLRTDQASMDPEEVEGSEVDGGNATTIPGLSKRTEPSTWGPTPGSQCKVDKGETGETSLTSCLPGVPVTGTPGDGDTLFIEEEQGKADSIEIIKASRRETEGRVTS